MIILIMINKFFFNNFQEYPPGFCCSCNAPYYGNGKECLRKGKNFGWTPEKELMDIGLPLTILQQHAHFMIRKPI